MPDDRFPDRLRNVLAQQVASGSRVLDAGCGDGGKYGTWLASLPGEYWGADISEQAVAAARRRGLQALRVSDITQLPFTDGSFDVCACVEVLEHLLFPLDCARELWRVLKPGGMLIATVPNTTYWRRRVDLALLGRWHPLGNLDGARRPWEDAHLRFFTRKTLARMLMEAGFETNVIGVGGSLFGDLPWVARRFGTDVLSRPFRFLEVALPSLFGANLVAIARKPADNERPAIPGSIRDRDISYIDSKGETRTRTKGSGS
jgi:ubiquinone/menaquinone biosynthesis C-methylase UbiE